MAEQIAQRVAALQMVSGHDLQANLKVAKRLMQTARATGASTVVLPENFAVLNTRQMVAQGQREVDDDGEIRRFLRQQARALGLCIVAGSLPLASRPDGSAINDRVRASCLVVDAQGHESARYDKIHLFDARVDDSHGQYRESDTFEPGEQVVAVETPAGRLGLSICFDLRFPELFRRLRSLGVAWVALPAAFTQHTGAAHWHTLLRARAIENQFWLVAAGQGGQNDSKRRTYGHSLIVDPWGQVVAEAGEGEAVIFADLDHQLTERVRGNMVMDPVLK
ncbi:MAG: carbon-nitrogen hydrolase family protein [Marinobacter sp.]|nr:carbon-nitrogen hydrolase family protein [Marinobacter sp.]